MTNRHESATGFAKRVSGAAGAIKAAHDASGASKAENAAKRRYGALRGDVEHGSFDTAARRHYTQGAIRSRRMSNAVLLLAYIAAGAVLYGLHTMLAPLR